MNKALNFSLKYNIKNANNPFSSEDAYYPKITSKHREKLANKASKPKNHKYSVKRNVEYEYFGTCENFGHFQQFGAY